MVYIVTNSVPLTVMIFGVTSTQVTVLGVSQDTRDQLAIKVNYYFTIYKDEKLCSLVLNGNFVFLFKKKMVYLYLCTIVYISNTDPWLKCYATLFLSGIC